MELVEQFHSKNPKSPRPVHLRMLQAQQGLKEGMLSRTRASGRDSGGHVTVGRSCDLLTPGGSRDPLRNRSPDQSRDSRRVVRDHVTKERPRVQIGRVAVDTSTKDGQGCPTKSLSDKEHNGTTPIGWKIRGSSHERSTDSHECERVPTKGITPLASIYSSPAADCGMTPSTAHSTRAQIPDLP